MLLGDRGFEADWFGRLSQAKGIEPGIQGFDRATGWSGNITGAIIDEPA
ncbi:hypothetical protein [Sphingomonas sp. T9W2]|jgi:hypothetical protein